MVFQYIIHSTTKIREVGSHFTSMHQKLEIAHEGEARVVLNAETGIVELERNHEAIVKDLKPEVNSQIQ